MFVGYAKYNRLRRQTIEEEIDIVAKTEVLGSLPHVKRDARLSLAGITAVKLDDPVIQAQTGKLAAQRLAVEHLQIEPPILHLRLGSSLKGLVGCRRGGTTFIQRKRVRAEGAKLGGRAGFILDLYEKNPPALFD